MQPIVICPMIHCDWPSNNITIATFLLNTLNSVTKSINGLSKIHLDNLLRYDR